MKISITYEDVKQIATSMAEKGEWPTVNGIRGVLGRGSFSTIQNYFSTWQKNFLRAKAGESTIPEHVTESFHAVYLEIDRLVSKRYEERITELEEKIALLQRDNEILKNIIRQSQL